VSTWYRKYMLTLDWAVPVVLWVIFVLCCELLWGRDHFVSSLEGTRSLLYATLAAVAASMLGFILAAAAIVLAVVPAPRFKRVRESRQYKTTWAALFRAIYCLAGLTIISFIGLLADTDAHPKPLITYLACGAVLLSAWSVYRAIWVVKNFAEIAATHDTRET
jgi:hypothetical protein